MIWISLSANLTFNTTKHNDYESYDDYLFKISLMNKEQAVF